MTLTLELRCGQDVLSYQKWSFWVNCFKSYSLKRQTQTQTLRKHYLKTGGCDQPLLCRWDFSFFRKILNFHIFNSGPIDRHKVYVTGLNEGITRDQLILNLEERVDCEVDKVVYGLDTTVAMVCFKEKTGDPLSIIYRFSLCRSWECCNQDVLEIVTVIFNDRPETDVLLVDEICGLESIKNTVIS